MSQCYFCDEPLPETEKSVCRNCIFEVKEKYLCTDIFSYRDYICIVINSNYVLTWTPDHDLFSKCSIAEAKSKIDEIENKILIANNEIHKRWRDEGITREFADFMNWSDPHPYTYEFCNELVQLAEGYFSGKWMFFPIKIYSQQQNEFFTEKFDFLKDYDNLQQLWS